ncbi:unnamed protein product [Tenebrio molitor]|nr:unnamed protein product [Tenebrio molitor]
MWPQRIIPELCWTLYRILRFVTSTNGTRRLSCRNSCFTGCACKKGYIRLQYMISGSCIPVVACSEHGFHIHYCNC